MLAAVKKETKNSDEKNKSGKVSDYAERKTHRTWRFNKRKKN